jgi:hypothetical protein
MRALARFYSDVLSRIENPTAFRHQSTQLAFNAASTDPNPLGGCATPDVKTAHDAAVTLLGPLYNLRSGPSSAPDARKVFGRLSVSVSESENTTTKLRPTSWYSLTIFLMFRRAVVARSLESETLQEHGRRLEARVEYFCLACCSVYLSDF